MAEEAEAREPSREQLEEEIKLKRARRQRRVLIQLLLLAILGALVYTQLTIFVIPPIGAVPEGRTLLITRLERFEFIDSADAVCEREQGSVNLLCRGVVLASVGENAHVLLRLPYSAFLYRISTDGREYER